MKSEDSNFPVKFEIFQCTFIGIVSTKLLILESVSTKILIIQKRLLVLIINFASYRDHAISLFYKLKILPFNVLYFYNAA